MHAGVATEGHPLQIPALGMRDVYPLPWNMRVFSPFCAPSKTASIHCHPNASKWVRCAEHYPELTMKKLFIFLSLLSLLSTSIVIAFGQGRPRRVGTQSS